MHDSRNDFIRNTGQKYDETTKSVQDQYKSDNKHPCISKARGRAAQKSPLTMDNYGPQPINES